MLCEMVKQLIFELLTIGEGDVHMFKSVKLTME